MQSSLLLLSFGLSLVDAICHHGTTLYHRRAEVEEPKFGYTNLDGPLAWHGLSAENMLCAQGQRQSPISVTGDNSSPAAGSSLAFDITDFPEGGELLNLGTTLEVEANGTMALNNKSYTLAQFHFHTPSEHRINGEYYPMEVHFVFQAADESLAVVGQMVEVAAMEVPAAFISSVFANLDRAGETGAAVETAPINFTALKEHIAASTIWQYEGSLTTPSCDEGVSWNVVENPLFISSTTYRQIKSVIKFNSRYTQNQPGEVNLVDNACTALTAEA
jgi:carbonic anhydrase